MYKILKSNDTTNYHDWQIDPYERENGISTIQDLKIKVDPTKDTSKNKTDKQPKRENDKLSKNGLEIWFWEHYKNSTKDSDCSNTTEITIKTTHLLSSNEEFMQFLNSKAKNFVREYNVIPRYGYNSINITYAKFYDLIADQI